MTPEHRFFIDHGVIHDSLSGRHVAADFAGDWQIRLLALLNEQEAKIHEARVQLVEDHQQLVASQSRVRELEGENERLRKGAERYRFLRDSKDAVIAPIFDTWKAAWDVLDNMEATAEEVDKAVDAAINAALAGPQQERGE